MEQAVNEGVHVFVGSDGRLARGNAIGHPIKPIADEFCLTRRIDPRRRQRRRPGLGESHIEGPEAEVGANGAVYRFELGCRTASEAAAPQLMRAITAAHEKLPRYARRQAESAAAVSA
jgi:hypothetical protein